MVICSSHTSPTEKFWNLDVNSRRMNSPECCSNGDEHNHSDEMCHSIDNKPSIISISTTTPYCVSPYQIFPTSSTPSAISSIANSYSPNLDDSHFSNNLPSLKPGMQSFVSKNFF